MRKRCIGLLVIGLLLIIGPFLFNGYSLWRLISLALGIILVVLSFVFKENKNVFLIILLPIILIVLSYGVDTLLFYKLERIPLFVYEVKSSDMVRTLNSFFYRIYDCDDSLVLDYGYTKNYVCSYEYLDVIEVNDFLREPQESFKNYHGKFVKISGKISKIIGKENIELSLYTNADNPINGYVNFNLNYILQVNTQENLSSYRIYDNIIVVGLVDTITEDNGKYTITLKDTLLVPSDIYDSYTYEMVLSDSKLLKPLIKDKEYYLYGISSLNVKYANDSIYELSYLITDSRITWEDLVDDVNAKIYKDEEENEIAREYNLKKFNLLDCSNGKRIIANKNYKISEETCVVDIESN